MKDVIELGSITSVIEEFLASDFEAIAMQAVNQAVKQKAKEETEAQAGFT
jgi:stage V sporulation protein SpoVS